MSKFVNQTSPVTLTDLKRSVYMVTIFYEELKYAFISQQAKTEVWDLVSNIGGSLGLFLGLSFLSMIDLVQIALEILFILFEKNRILNV